MMNRKKFLKSTAAAGALLSSAAMLKSCQSEKPITDHHPSTRPIAFATWNVLPSTEAAWEVMNKGGSALDAVEAGCRIEEINATNQTVGLGGLPDRDGHVTLDASIMNHEGNCGSVVYMKDIVHAVSVARKVMEDTPHVMLAGAGARQFALEQGYEERDLLTPKSKEAWEQWKIKSEYQPVINIENHDTIGLLALDHSGRLSGACTTSGLAYKMAGRVGDSPIIGSGLYVDNQVGAAVATGLGEEVVKTVGSFLIVELMRQGKSPQEACMEAIHRIVDKPGSNYKNFQVGYIAINPSGEYGSYAIHPGFTTSIYKEDRNEVIRSESFITS